MNLGVLLFYFAVYLTVVAVFSRSFIRSLALTYDAFNTYHYLSHEDGNDEKLSTKIRLVAEYNAFGAIFATLVTIGVQIVSRSFQTVPETFKLTLSAQIVMAIGILGTVFNTSVRLAAFGVLSREDDECGNEFVKDAIFGMGFSFWATLYFFLVFGAGLSFVVTGYNNIVFPQFGIPFREAVIRVLVVLIIFPLLGALLSELALYSIEFPDNYKKEN